MLPRMSPPKMRNFTKQNLSISSWMAELTSIEDLALPLEV